MIVEHINVEAGGRANIGRVDLAQQQNNLPNDNNAGEILDLKPTHDFDWLD